VVFTAYYDDSTLRRVKQGNQTTIVRRINEGVVDGPGNMSGALQFVRSTSIRRPTGN
jgi:hypothetical protein